MRILGITWIHAALTRDVASICSHFFVISLLSLKGVIKALDATIPVPPCGILKTPFFCLFGCNKWLVWNRRPVSSARLLTCLMLLLATLVSCKINASSFHCRQWGWEINESMLATVQDQWSGPSPGYPKVALNEIIFLSPLKYQETILKTRDAKMAELWSQSFLNCLYFMAKQTITSKTHQHAWSRGKVLFMEISEKQQSMIFPSWMQGKTLDEQNLQLLWDCVMQTSSDTTALDTRNDWNTLVTPSFDKMGTATDPLINEIQPRHFGYRLQNDPSDKTWQLRVAIVPNDTKYTCCSL